MWRRAIGDSVGTMAPCAPRYGNVLIALLTLTGCGSGSGDADDVPTITTRPSTPASSTAPTDVTTAPTETTATTGAVDERNGVHRSLSDRDDRGAADVGCTS